MAIIYSYPEIPDVQGGDLLLISDTGAPNKPTRSVDIDDLAAYIGTVVGVVQNLQSVLTVGNTYVSADGYGTFTLNDIANNDGSITFVNTDEGWGYQISAEEGINITDGSGTNLMSIQSSGLSIRDGAQTMNIGTNALTATRNVYFPDASGTLALTSDIPSPGVSGSGTTNYVARWTSASALGIGALYDNGTNVGIGINGTYANPPQRLTVVSDDSLQPVAQFKNIGAGGGLFVRTDGTTRPLFELFSGSSYRVVVTGTGNVGIGTTSPGEKLEVAGNARITGDVTLSNGNALRWTSDDVRIEGTTAGDNIKFYVANTEILQLAQSGTLATVTGNLRVTGAYYDSNNSPGTANQVLVSTATGTDWVDGSGLPGGPYLPLSAGSTKPLTGNLYINDSIPKLIFTDTDTSTVASISANSSNLTYTTVTSARDHIFKAGTDTLVTIEGAGNVGIGTTTPNAKLHIGPTSLVSGYTPDRSTLAISDTTNGGQLIIRGQSPRIWFDATAGGNAELFLDGSKLNILSGSPDGLGSSRLYIKADGNVGIGTTSPQQKLDVIGRVRASYNTFNYYEIGASSAGGFVVGKSGGIETVNIRTYGDSHFNGGNVGIGTTSPSAKLEVEGLNAGLELDALILKNNSTTGGTATVLKFVNSTDSTSANNTSYIKSIRNAGNDNDLVFGTYANDRMTIDSLGNVGIGTTSPNEKLEVAGNIRTNVANGKGFMLTGSSASGLVRNAGTGLALRTNSIDKLIINSTGSVTFSAYTGANEQGTPTYLLGTDVSGNIVKTNTVPGSAAGPYLPLAGGAMTGSIKNGDGVYSYWGTGDDLQIGHDGSNSYIIDRGIGDLLLYYSDDFVVSKYGTSEISIRANQDSSVELFFDNSKKFETSNTGVSVTGNGIFTGNVGIGTTSPSVNLDIEDSSNVIVDMNTTTANANTTIRLQESGTVKATIGYDGTNNGLILTTGGFTAGNGIFIDDSQNVGIGTDNPAQDLTLYRNSGDTNFLISSNNGASQIFFGDTESDNIGKIDYDHSDDSLNFVVNASERMRITSTGNVGIGTTSPSAKLDVSDSIPVLRITGTRNASWTIGQTMASLEYFSKDASGSSAESVRASINLVNEASVYGSTTGLSFSTKGDVAGSPIEAMRINASGNVGIGTTSPDEKLDIVGKQIFSATGSSYYGNPAAFNTASNGDKIIFYNDGTSYDGRIGVGSTSNLWLKSYGETANEGDIEFYAGGSQRAIVKGSGNVGIGTTSPGAKLSVNGNVKIEGTNSLLFGGSASIPSWAINHNGSDLLIDDQGGNIGSVLFNNSEGVALPRLTTTEINAISSPAQGLMAYNTTLNTICFYNGSSWQKVSHANM